MAAWVLAPGLERGSAAPAFPLSPTTEWVRLRLVLEDDPHPLYEVSVETADGQMVAHSSRLRSRAAVGGRRELMDVVVSGRTMHGGTYNSNAMACAAVIAAWLTVAIGVGGRPFTL